MNEDLINHFRLIEVPVFFTTAETLEELIYKRFNKKIRLIDDQECGNYVCKHWEFKIENEERAGWAEKEVKEWLDGKNKNHILADILQSLVNKKELPEGNYIIDLAW